MSVLGQIEDLWLKQIEGCRKAKQQHFGETAAQCWRYMGRRGDALDLSEEEMAEAMPLPEQYSSRYRPVLNKAREFVSTVLPFVSAKIPTRTATPWRPPLPPGLLSLMPSAGASPATQLDEKLRCFLLSWWLNYLPRVYGLPRESREAVPEALVKGRGVVWHELDQDDEGRYMPVTTQDTVDGLLCDPDARKWRNCGYIIRERSTQKWELAKMFDVPLDQIQGDYQSHYWEAGQSIYAQDSSEDRDVAIWYEFYSRMGVGHYLSGANEDIANTLGAVSESLGHNVYLALLPGLGHPMNLKPEHLSLPNPEQQLKQRLKWPIPYWRVEEDPWPCTPLDIYPNSTDPWATSAMAGGLPLQRILDRFYSYLKDRVKRTCRDITLTSTAIADDLRSALEDEFDQGVVPVDGKVKEELEKCVAILKFNPVNADVYHVLQIIESAFERVTGMTPLLSGAMDSKQMRSSAEAQIRQANATSRPEDYADAVESWHGLVAKKEAIATRLNVDADAVALLLGEPVLSATVTGGASQPLYGPLTEAWMRLVYARKEGRGDDEDEREACSDVLYGIEVGSGRRKNAQKLMADAQAMAQMLMPLLYQHAMTSGNVAPFNNLLDKIGEAWGTSMDDLHLAPPAPPQPGMMPGQPGQPPPGMPPGQGMSPPNMEEILARMGQGVPPSAPLPEDEM